MEQLKVLTQESKDMVALADAEETLISGYKEIMFGNKKVFVRHPNLKEQGMLQKDYAIQFGRMIKDPDIMTRRQLAKILEDKGIWTEKEERSLEEIRKTYSDYYKEWYSWDYEDRVDNPEFDRINELYLNSMTKFMMAYTEKESMFSTTVEKLIETSQIVKKLYLCTIIDPKTDKRLFETEEEVSNCPDGDAIAMLISECTNFWMGISERFLGQLPGNTSGSANMTQPQVNAQ